MPAAEVAELLPRYHLRLPVATRGVAGEVLGRGTGASLEFQDRRAYTPGDDLRHLDWRAYARTDQLLVRLYREEIAPRLEVLVDASRSMAVDATKATFTRDLTALLCGLARAAGLPVTCIRLGRAAEPLAVEQVMAGAIEFDGERPWPALLPAARELLRRGSLRLCVSDFLFPTTAAEVVRPLARDAGELALLQVLGAGDEAPPIGAAVQLTDVETGARRDLVLDRHAIDGYLARLAAWSEALAGECRRAAAPFVPLSAAAGLRAACDSRLLRAGVLVPNGRAR